MATTNDLKNGLVLNLDGQLWTVVEFQHVKPGKGGAFVRTTLKNVLSGKVVDRTFNAGTKVETANVDKRAMTYLYREGDDFVFMDSDTYDQMHGAGRHRRRRRELPARQRRGGRRRARRHRRSTSSCRPASSCVISHTDPGLQGDRSTGGTKPATLETGAEIQVPLFVTHRREGQGRHPRRPLPRPRQQLTMSRAQQGPQARGRRALRGRPARHRRDRRRWPSGSRWPSRRSTTTRSRWSRASPSTAIASTRSWPSYAEGWTIDRMPGVDRAVLRLGVYELLWRDDVPDAVAIDEAVELAKSLSTDESPRFVNGVLARVLRDRPDRSRDADRSGEVPGFTARRRG